MQKTILNKTDELNSSGVHQQGKTFATTAKEMHKINVNKEQRKDMGNLQSVLAEMNDVAVDLYKIEEYSIASKMLEDTLNTITGIFIPMQQDFCHCIKDVASKLSQQIESGKEVCHKKSTCSRIHELDKMDIYFYPSSLCDRSAFLSEPFKICEHSSNNDEQDIEIEVGVIMFNMALVCIKQEAIQGAHDLLKLTIDVISKNILAKSKLTPFILNSLGCIYYRKRKFDSASLNFQMAFEAAQMELQRRNQAKTAGYMSLLQCWGTISSNIGRVCFIQKQYEDAIAHCMDALQSRKTALGEDHIEVYSTLYNLGFIKQQQGSFNEAIVFYNIILDYVCVSKHRDIPNQDVVTLIINFLLIHCKKITFFTKSYDVLRELKRLQSLRDNFGYDYHQTQVVLGRIAAALFELSLYQFALPFLFEQLRIEKIVLGNDHSQLAVTLSSIGQAYQEQNFHQQAISYFTKALKFFKRSGDKKMLAATNFNIGMNYTQTDRHHQALCLFHEAVKMQKEFYGEYHPEVADMMYNIGVAQLEVGRVDEALDKFMEALLIRRLVFGNNHTNVIEVLHRIAQIHDLKGEKEESLNVLYQALHVERKDSPFSISVAKTLQNIAQIHHFMGNLEKAINTYEETLSVLIENVGTNHQVVASLLNVLGNLCMESGKISDSVLAYMKSQKIMEKIKSTGEATDNKTDLKILSLFGYSSEQQATAAAAA